MNLLSNKRRLYTALAALAAFSIGGGLYFSFRKSDLCMVGIVDARQVIIGSRLDARVEALLVSEGQAVKEGDLLAVLDDREPKAALDYSVAQAGGLERQLTAAQFSALSMEGETAGAIANARSALEAAEAARAEAAANRKNQQSITQRALTLAQQGVLSVQEQETAERSLEALQARELSASRAVDQARAGLRSAEAKEHQARAARETVAAIEGQLNAAKAQVREAATRLDHTRILAPVSGRVSTLVAYAGEQISQGAAILLLTDLSETWVYASLPESEADDISINQTLRVRMPGGTWTEGRVIHKSMEAEFATQRDVNSEKRDIRAVRLKLRVPNENGRFVPGMTAETILPAMQRRHA